jgi:hypothetical protein
LELRAANDLARLWRYSNSGGKVHALLEPILEAVEGGADTRDVRNAHELLAAAPEKNGPAPMAYRMAGAVGRWNFGSGHGLIKATSIRSIFRQ